MRAGVRSGAARPAPAQLRGRAWRLSAPLRVAPASRVALGAARRPRLDQGCVMRLVAAVAAQAEPPRRRGRPRNTADSEAVLAEPVARERRAGNAGECVAGSPAQPKPPKRKRRAPSVGEPGETTPDGRPKPDERTVADLVRRGWFKSEEEVVALLTRAKASSTRYAFETAEPAADWLEATLGPEPVKDGLCPAARAVKGDPSLLYRDAATLQRKWDALMLPTELGGVGIAFSTEQAREAVRKHPPLLGYSVETFKECWSMLTAPDNGLILPHDEARKCILRGPGILRFDLNSAVRRVALLKSLGYPDALEMVLAQPQLLNYKEETVMEHAAWWQQCGLDHLKIITALPTLLGGVSVEELQAKLDFLRQVVGMSNEDLNKAGVLFSYSLDGRLRARFFYALQKHRLARFGTMSTMMKETDASFLAMMQGRPYKDRASKTAVARYRKLVMSAGFVAWRERQEA